jgi:hypothetical protein
VTSSYGWFATIDGLANGDILKFDAITKLPLLTCLTKMSLEADKSIEREKEHRKNKRK